MKKIFLIGGAAIIALVFIIWQIIWFFSWQNSSLIFSGVKINGLDMGGLDIESARVRLEQYTKEHLENNIIALSYEDTQNSVTAYDFTNYDFMNKEHDAYQVGRTENKLNDYFSMVKAKLFGIDFSLEPVFDDTALEQILSSKSGDYMTAAQDAYIYSFDPNAQEGNRLSIADEVSGLQIDIEKTSLAIKAAVTEGKSSADVTVIPLEANITKELLQTIDGKPIFTEYTIKDITAENESAILQIINSGLQTIIYPGQMVDISQFLGGDEYIYFNMPDGGTRSDYEIALTEQIPTQIFIACVMSEVDVTERTMDELNKKGLPVGISTVINQYYKLIIQNNLGLPILLRVGYKNEGVVSQIFCEIYRSPMEYAALLRPIIKPVDGGTQVDIYRIYIDETGTPLDSVLIDTVVAQD